MDYFLQVMCFFFNSVMSKFKGIAAVLNKMGKSKVTVGVDGSLYRFHPHFGENMLSTTRKLTFSNIQVWQTTLYFVNSVYNKSYLNHLFNLL